MTTEYQKDLAERAEIAAEQGKEELASELDILAGNKEEQVSTEDTGDDDIGVLLSDIEEDTLDWYWRNWFPLSGLTILTGKTSRGKSTIGSDIIARGTRGDLMPDGTACEAPGGAVIISLEEKTASMVKPRLRKAGADLSRIIDLSVVKRKVNATGMPVYTPFMLPDDIENGNLERAVKRVNATLIWIDPLSQAFNPGVSMFRGQSARKVLILFKAVAERLGIAVVFVNHFNKNGGKNPLDDMNGSGAFPAFVRSVVLLSDAADNPKHRVLSLIKHNNAPDMPDIVLEHNGSTVKYLDGVTPDQKLINAAKAQSTATQRVLAILADQPDVLFTPSVLAQRCDIHHDTMKVYLRRMYGSGLILNPSYSFYKHKPVILVTPVTLEDKSTPSAVTEMLAS